MSRISKWVLCLLVATGVVLAVSQEATAQAKKKPPQKKKAYSRPIRPIDDSVVNTSWRVTISLNSADRTYRDGDKVIVKVSSARAGYLYLFNIVPGQEPVCIFPNANQTNNKIDANDVITVGGLVAKEPAGKEGLLAYVSNQPSQVPELSTRNLTRRGVKFKKVSRRAVKTLLVKEGMGARELTPEPGGTVVGDPPGGGDEPSPPPAPFSIQKDKDKIKKEEPIQYQGKLKQWASAIAEVEIVAGKADQDDKPVQDKSKQDKSTKRPRP